MEECRAMTREQKVQLDCDACEIVKRVATETGPNALDPHPVQPLALFDSRRKTRKIVALRHRVIAELAKMGYSQPQIGWVLGLHHSTVNLALKSMRRQEAAGKSPA